MFLLKLDSGYATFDTRLVDILRALAGENAYFVELLRKFGDNSCRSSGSDPARALRKNEPQRICPSCDAYLRVFEIGSAADFDPSHGNCRVVKLRNCGMKSHLSKSPNHQITNSPSSQLRETVTELNASRSCLRAAPGDAARMSDSPIRNA